MLDCIVIGGGPAGLSAATYLARFRRSVSVMDAGNSRAMLIPCSNNVPGFPTGISGEDLLSQLRLQAARFAVPIEQAAVTALKRGQEGFTVEAGGKVLRARAVMLATGVSDRMLDLSNVRQLVRDGLVRLCPVCDGYEVEGSSVGVVGPAERSVLEARFLRTYTDRVTALVSDATQMGTTSAEDEARRSGVRIERGGICALHPCGSGVVAILKDGRELEFASLYLALGADPASVLGLPLGTNVNASGCIAVDKHQRTSVPGLYAAGDVVEQLNQIAVAFGHAAIAATAIHNDLRDGRIVGHRWRQDGTCSSSG